jgi:hypothetical protein
VGRADPQDEQKFTLGGFRCPQLWQNTPHTVLVSSFVFVGR